RDSTMREAVRGQVVIAVTNIVAEVVVPERSTYGGQILGSAIVRLRRLHEAPELRRVRAGQVSGVIRCVEVPLAAHADFVGIRARAEEPVPDRGGGRGREA